jgi:DNA polymerase-3 subunit alpha (Gram-positive type)
VAHNISFDIPFFYSVLKRLNRPIPKNKTLCTNLMTRYLLPSLVNSNLNYMCSLFKIPHINAHRAVDDAKASANLLLIYFNIFIEKGIKKINHIYYPRNRFELDRKNFQKGTTSQSIFEDLKKITTPFTFKIKGEKGKILFMLPCIGAPEEWEFLKEKIKNLHWELITVRLYGTFLETLILFSNLAYKMKRENVHEILDFLWKTKIPGLKRTPDLPDGPLNNSQIGDFIFTNHLIPGQYILFSLNSLNHTSTNPEIPRPEKEIVAIPDFKKHESAKKGGTKNHFSFGTDQGFFGKFFKSENRSLFYIQQKPALKRT